MRHRLFTTLAAIALALSWGAATPADASRYKVKAHRGTASVCPNDGHTGAPSGATISHAAARAGVSVPPTCQYPDVDYGVGPTSAALAALKNPKTDPPANSDAYYAPQNTVGCTAAGVVWDGYDFTVDGGVTLVGNTGCTGVIVRNSKFGKGTNCVGVTFTANSGPDITFINNEVDGGGAAGQAACVGLGFDNGEMVQILGSGAKVIQYNRVHDVDQHFFTVAGAGTVDFRFNAVGDCGYEQGAHCNGIQITGIGNTTSLKLSNNFFYDRQPDTASVAYTTTYTSASASVAVTVPGVTQSSFIPGMQVTGTRITGTGYICSVSDAGSLPVTSTLTLGTNIGCGTPLNANSTGSGTLTVTTAYPVGVTIAVRASVEGTDTVAISGGEIKDNWIYAPGPIKTQTYSVHCAFANPPTQSFAATVSGNYYAPAGTSGGLYHPSSNCTPATTGSYTGFRTDTGAAVSAP